MVTSYNKELIKSGLNELLLFWSGGFINLNDTTIKQSLRDNTIPSKKDIIKLHVEQIISDLCSKVTQSLPRNSDHSSVGTINAVEWSMEY